MKKKLIIGLITGLLIIAVVAVVIVFVVLKPFENKHTHDYGYGVITKVATCTETGVKTFTCSVCGETKTETIPAKGHTAVSANNGTAATCTAAGKESDTVCSVCRTTLTVGKEILALGHSYENGACTRCGAKDPSADQLYTRVDENGNESSTGKYILFGSYPQSEVTDSATKANLTWKDAQTTALPTSKNANGWTDYGYYISGSVSSYMWYKDVTYSGNEYRAVYFTSYRPYWTDYSSSTGNSYQYTSGYYLSTVYWFKYEPIKWRILEESNGTAFLMADIILDSQQYYHTTSSSTRTAVENYSDAYYAGSGSTVTASAYANNYLYSEIRSWLNETFYETAFTEYEKQLVQTTLVDNSAATTASSTNSYACANTNDKVFLLSYQDVMNSSYGFSTSSSSYDTARQLKSTAYAKSQGCYASTESSYSGNGWWLLRSPYYSVSYNARYVNGGGDAGEIGDVSRASGGVVPALHIRLS